jgi:hypothetical protein
LEKESVMMLLKPDHDIVLIQSADSLNYFRMLQATSKITAEYCKAWDILYECHYGVMRGFHPWQACLNRIYLLANLIEQGFEGWYIHLDSDAWVQDMRFDLRGYLRGLGGVSFVFTPGASAEAWDVNDGIFFANCAHPDTREVALAWRDLALQTGPDALRAATGWYQVPCDQSMLHAVLRREDNRLCAAIYRETPHFINGPGPGTRFIRQVLRAAYADEAQRRDQITLGAERALALHATRPDEAIEAFCLLARALDLPIPAERDSLRAIMASPESLRRFLGGGPPPPAG